MRVSSGRHKARRSFLKEEQERFDHRDYLLATVCSKNNKFYASFFKKSAFLMALTVTVSLALSAWPESFQRGRAAEG